MVEAAAPPPAAGSTPRDGLKDEPRQKEIGQSVTKNQSMNMFNCERACVTRQILFFRLIIINRYSL